MSRLLTLNCLSEDKPGPQWKSLFARVWPYYRRWFLRPGPLERPGYLTSRHALETVMPELVPLYAKLCALAGGGDLSARFLSLYCPPAFMTGCSQLAWTRGPAALIRNYDYNPDWFEGVMLRSHWLKPVIGMSDCTWGLLDGMNGDGLAASLSFGGREVSGVGFGITLVLRYVLETCANVKEAIRTLSRIKVHMAYNVTLLDKSRECATVYLGPDRTPGVVQKAFCANHQEEIDWPEYAQTTGTVQRAELLGSYMNDPTMTLQDLKAQFLRPPLHKADCENSFATLYTSVWSPEDGKVEMFWPRGNLHQSFDSFTPGTVEVDLSQTSLDSPAACTELLLESHDQL